MSPSEFPVPDGVTKVKLCADDGLLAGEFNTRVIEAVFVRGTEPISKCYGFGPVDYLPYQVSPPFWKVIWAYLILKRCCRTF